MSTVLTKEERAEAQAKLVADSETRTAEFVAQVEAMSDEGVVLGYPDYGLYMVLDEDRVAGLPWATVFPKPTDHWIVNGKEERGRWLGVKTAKALALKSAKKAHADLLEMIEVAKAQEA